MIPAGSNAIGFVPEPRFIAGQVTGTCCREGAKRNDYPLNPVGRRGTRDHSTCEVCTWWNERCCIHFEIDRNFLKL